MTDLYRCTPRQVRQFAIQILEAGLVPYIQSSPGMGKSSIVRSISDEYYMHMIDHRLSTSAPEDMSGLPRFDADGTARFAPFADLFPIAGTPVPKGKHGWMLFLDEFNSAPKSVQAAAYKLILDRMTGQYKLDDKVMICAAGNLATDRAIVNPLSTAMQSRVIHLEMQISHEEWMYDVALKQKYDSRIVGYLSQYPSKLMDFRPDHQDKTFCCPRTWEFVNKLIIGREVNDTTAVLLAGTITSGTAADFVQFCRIYESMISFNEIMRDPQNAAVPQDLSTKWAVISSLMEKINAENFDALAKYVDRFTADFRILFYRSVIVQQPTLRAHPSFARALIELSRYLNG